MFVDASALVAMVDREDGFERLAAVLDAHEGDVYISPIVRLEAALAIARRRTKLKSGRIRADDLAQAARSVKVFVEETGASDVAIDSKLGAEAINACADFGKAVGHPARLNLGDCFSYAAAKTLGVPLLYKGDDFAKTDLA